MTLHIYDSATRSRRRFEPLVPGKASIYLCGLTVQSAPHIGHLRSSVNFDILRRWLEYTGHDVTFVRNVTDIDDKILAKSAETGRVVGLGVPNERAVIDAYAALGCLPATYEPRATGHVPEMIELMQQLIERGHAYAVDGDVYFDVRSYPDYGALSGQKIDDMLPAGDSIEADKRDPRDFALWKSTKPGEPATASWATPWGRGRPGWHLECSAMAGKYLGDAFDIHGGGLDLIFPHHENEIAQSVSAGDRFAQYWMHNAWVTMSGREDVQVVGQFAVGERDPQAMASGRGALLPRRGPLPLAMSSTRMRRWPRRPRPTAASRVSCSGPASAWTSCARVIRRSVRATDRRRRSSPRWTTTSACRRRWPRSTGRCGTATRAGGAGSERCSTWSGRCWR